MHFLIVKLTLEVSSPTGNESNCSSILLQTKLPMLHISNGSPLLEHVSIILEQIFQFTAVSASIFCPSRRSSLALARPIDSINVREEQNSGTELLE